MAQYPYICLIACSLHLHYPPYPIKLSIDLADDVVEAIRQAEVLSLTTRTLSICSAYACKTLTII